MSDKKYTPSEIRRRFVEAIMADAELMQLLVEGITKQLTLDQTHFATLAEARGYSRPTHQPAVQHIFQVPQASPPVVNVQLPEQAAPVVNVAPPVVNVAPAVANFHLAEDAMPVPVVNVINKVETPTVEVTVQPADVTVTPHGPMRKTIERDAAGNITTIHEEPV